MVILSMCGSSASVAYGNAGNVKAIIISLKFNDLCNKYKALNCDFCSNKCHVLLVHHLQVVLLVLCAGKVIFLQQTINTLTKNICIQGLNYPIKDESKKYCLVRQRQKLMQK